MAERTEDSLNSILFAARNHINELRDNIYQEDTNITSLVGQIDSISSELKEDSKKIEDISRTQSKTLPIMISKPKTPRRTTSKTQYPPKDEVKIRNTKASLLKKNFTKRQKETKKLPVLKGAVKYMDASTLLAKGIASKDDDLSNVLPAVEPSTNRERKVFFPNLHVDIAGAAREMHRTKLIKEREKALKMQALAEMEEEEEKKEEEHKEENPIINKEPEKARVYEQIQDEFAYQTLLIIHGKIARETPDFESFKRTNVARADKIENILSKIEQICDIFKISYAEIDGRKLSEAADLEKVDLKQALECIIGVDDKVKAVFTKSAIIIQRNFRLYRERQVVNKRKLEFRAAMVIQEFWRMKKDKDIFMRDVRDRINSVESRADELTKTIVNSYKAIESDPYVEIHVITNPLDLMRVFQLMYTNVQLIIITHYLPHPHIWEEFLLFMSYCGINDVNDRINFIPLKEINGNNGISNRLYMDLKSVKNVKRLICGRSAFIVPHSDWDSEIQLSVDISVPIFGCVNPEYLQSRTAIMDVFHKAGIITPLSTIESNDIGELGVNARFMMKKNRDLKRWIVRLSYIQSEDAIGWFDANRDVIYSTNTFENVLKKVITTTTKKSQFIKRITELGATIEAVPTLIYSFPSVSLLLTGNEIRVIGTFDKMHHSPYKFGSIITPCISVNPQQLLSMARATASELMKRGVIGYVCIDFLAFKEENKVRLIGFDIRLNSYPALLQACYLTLCAGYDEASNKIIMLKKSSNNNDINQSVVRYAVLHSGLTHEAFSLLGSNDIKKECFNNGFMFDILQRTGFTTVFFDAPAEGKSFSIASALTSEQAINLFEKGYTFLGKYLSSKVTDENSTVARALISVRHFKTRLFK